MLLVLFCSVRALTDLTVAPDVCLELCLPFWKCQALGKPTKHLAKVAPPSGMAKVTPPHLELNNNREMVSKEAPWTLKDTSTIPKENEAVKSEASSSETGKRPSDARHGDGLLQHAA